MGYARAPGVPRLPTIGFSCLFSRGLKRLGAAERIPRSPQTKSGTYNWRITYTTGHAVSSLFMCYHNESLSYHKIYTVLYRIPYIIITIIINNNNIVLLYLHIEHNVSLQNSHVELPATSCAPLVLPPSAHPQHLKGNRVPGGLDGGWYPPKT